MKMMSLTYAAITWLALVCVSGASINLEPTDYEVLSDNEGKSSVDDNEDSNGQEIRCYCNRPECVRQSYMCRGRSCFTELPPNVHSSLLRTVEHSPSSGCLEESVKFRGCPAGLLCCEQDLCNHVDSPALRNRLNKTLQVLIGDQRAYSSPVQPTSQSSQTTDSWFRTATIAVPICGLIVLLILASLAIRLLQPTPTQSDKLGPHGMSDNGPPLLGTPKVPLV